MIRILFVGDVSGRYGRRAVSTLLGALRSRFDLKLVILNGENAAGGLGITKPTASALFDAGADVITLGNHAFAKKDALDLVQKEPRVLRPANYPAGAPGNGWGVFNTSDGHSVAVANILGRVFMNPMECPFRTADDFLDNVSQEAKISIIDIHAEATSEKVALAYYVSGRASAVIGTHTHIQTSDERVFPEGTAYITDAGMTGVLDSVLGLEPQEVIYRFKTQLPGRFALANGTATLQGVLLDIDESTGHAINIQRISVPETDI